MRKGFTLIELLAVIVILAIIALIATPVILGIVNNVKEESNKRSIEMYAKAIENAVATNQLTSGDKIIGSFNTQDGKNLILTGQEEPSLIVNYKGKVICDIVEIREDGTSYLGGCTVNRSNNKYIYNKTVQLLEPTQSFEKDSWETILYNVKIGNIGVYEANLKENKNNTKEITLTSDDTNIAGTYTVRIANTSTPNECNTEGYSQTACGFVVEFVDIITKQGMNPTNTTKGGWKDSEMREYVNNIIFNAFPVELKDALLDTIVVSGYGVNDSKINFITKDKVYLLSTKEVWGENIIDDAAKNETKQLDYYKNQGVTISNNKSTAIKNYKGSPTDWWLRSVSSTGGAFWTVLSNGYFMGVNSNFMSGSGIAPAFRIG